MTDILKDSALRAAVDAVVQPIGRARGLPNRAYTDAALFAFERDHVLGRGWAAIGYGSELPARGSVRPVDFMGLPLLIARDKTDCVRVFHNVCSHRGMQLVAEPGAVGKLIRCPYHSWSYSLDGKLIATPHIGGVDQHDCAGFDRQEHGLKAVRSAVWLDIVFVNLSGDAEPFEAYIGRLQQRWSAFVGPQGFAALRVAPTGSQLEIDVRSNWKLPVENYCEAYHLPWLHPGLNTYSPLDEHYAIMDGPALSGQGSYRYQPDTGVASPLPQFADWPQDKLHHAEYISLYPNTLLGLQVDHVFSVILLPEKPDATQEKLQLSYIGDDATDDRFAATRDAVLRSWKIVFGEDIDAVEGMQRGRASPGFAGGVFTPVQDQPTHHFHSWVANRYRAALT